MNEMSEEPNSKSNDQAKNDSQITNNNESKNNKMNEAKVEKNTNNVGSIGVIVLVLVLLASLGGFGYGYYQLSQVNSQLAKMMTSLQNRVADNQVDKQGLQETVSDIKSTLQKSQTLSTQQEQFINEWHAAQQGDLNKWRVAEAQNLTKLADTQLQYTHDVKAAIILLQQANQTLQNTQGNLLLAIRQSLTSDLTALQALQPVDKTAIFLHLHELSELVDKLSLPASPFKAGQQSAQSTPSSELPWWKSGLASAWNNISKLVIVRRTDVSSTPLVLPDEKVFLYQNLHLQLENASWGLLHDNVDVYKTSLLKAAKWTQQYFEQNDQATKTMLKGLSELQQINITPTAATLTKTLKLFDEYFSSVSSVNSVTIAPTKS